VKDVPEMRSVLSLYGGTCGLFAPTVFAPLKASDLFKLSSLRTGGNEPGNELTDDSFRSLLGIDTFREQQS
jgi:hypothetical protein